MKPYVKFVLIVVVFGLWILMNQLMNRDTSTAPTAPASPAAATAPAVSDGGGCSCGGGTCSPTHSKASK